MTDAELIAMARLAQRDERMSTGALYGDLADRIEALLEQCEGLAQVVDYNWVKHQRVIAAEARAERLEEALLWCSGSADFNEGGVAREGWLKVCAPLLKGESHD